MRITHGKLIASIISWPLLLGLVACGGDDDTPTPRPTSPSVPATATPADTPTPTIITITVAGTPVVVTATPAPTVAPSPTPVVMPKPEGSLNVAVPSLGNEDWLLRMYSQERHYVDPMADSLMPTPVIGRGDLPGLAESWEVTNLPDGQVEWTFTLRSGIQFHGGWGELTAEDMKETLISFGKEGTLNGTGNKVFRQWLDSDPSRFQVTGRYTFVVTSPSPVADMFDNRLTKHAATTWVFPKRYMDQVGEDGFREAPVFTGPFEFGEHLREQVLKMEAVVDHWRVVPDFASLNLLKVPEVATAIAMVRTEIADIAGIPSKFRPEAVAAGLRITEADTAGEDFVSLGGMFYAVPREGFGAGTPWVGSFDIKDPVGGENALKVRKALNLAIDRQAILDKVLLGAGYLSALSFAFQKEGQPWWNSAWEPYPYDPVLAKQLLTEAGYPDGFSINFWLIIQATSTRGMDESEAVASMWEQNLGLDVNRQVIEYRPTVRSSLIDRTTGGFAFTWNNDVVTKPSIYGCGPGGPSTFVVVHWEHPMWDDKCALLTTTVDPVEQAKITKELGDFFYRNYPNIPLAYLNALFAIGPKVDFWKPRDLADAPTLLEYATSAS